MNIKEALQELLQLRDDRISLIESDIDGTDDEYRRQVEAIDIVLNRFGSLVMENHEAKSRLKQMKGYNNFIAKCAAGT